MRCIYVLPRVEKWILDVLPTLESTWNIFEPPIEQLDALVYEFCSGKPLQVGTRFRCLVHLGNGVWELKTADLRLFGWFARKDCFIVTDGNRADIVKQAHLYRPYCEQAVRFCNALRLDKPKFIDGDDPSHVVTDCYYP